MHYFRNKIGIAAMLTLLLALMSLISTSAYAEPVKLAVNQVASTDMQNLDLLKDKIRDYLNIQTKGYPGTVAIQTGAIDNRLKLSACADVNIFMPRGSRPWGKTSVGVQCEAPSAWTIYVQVMVKVHGQYLVAAAPLAQGQTVSEQDVIFEKGDLTQLPAGIFTDLSQVVGKVVNMSMRAGTVLSNSLLKEMPVVQQGQTVTLITAGNGFSISAEGSAVSKATEGQVVRVKVASGQVVTGVARADGRVEVNY